jgi:Zn-dependent protease with chaperone function
VLAIIGTARVIHALVVHHRQRCVNTPALEIVPSDDHFAYTLPGPAGTIAISRGLQQALSKREFEVVVAHEQAHARHRHDRLLLLANTTTAFVPMMRPLATRLEHLLERWADEQASETTGYTRRFVASTIARVAVTMPAAGSAPSPALGIANVGAAVRAQALVAPRTRPERRTYMAVWALAAVTVSQSLSQLHHTLEFGVRLLP